MRKTRKPSTTSRPSTRRRRRAERRAARPATIGRRAMRFATAGATLGLVAALTVLGTGLGDDEGSPYEAASERPSLPQGSPIPGYVGAEDTALDLATAFDAVEISPGEPCPEDQLSVSWDDPEGYETGSHYTPVGPRPEGNESANGILFCEGSTFDYTGFNITWDSGRWSADLAPDFGDDHADDDADPEEPVEPDAPVDPADPDEPPVDPDLPVPSGPDDLVDRLGSTLTEVTDIADLELTDTWHGLFDEFPIEEPAPYEPQAVCSPSPKPGTFGFSEIVLDAFDTTGTSGISRACDQGGRSEHKEGRAWDWSALVDDPDDAAAASQVIGWLLATDEHGEAYAMARRLGVMYIIYNQSIWRSYAPEQGWVGYTGPNPHTDHVHFSFSRDGGAGETSFWDVAELPDISSADFGPYAYLPDAGGVSHGADQPAVIFGDDRPGGRPDRPVLPFPGRPGPGPGPGGPGPGGEPPGTPDPTLPGDPPPNLPGPTLPGPLPDVPLPTLPPIGGDDDDDGGLLPTCPPGTPLFPLPVHCLLPRP